MDFIQIAYLSIAALLVLIALRVPIGISLIAVSFAGIWMSTSVGAAWGMVRAVPYNFVANWEFSAVPMFLLMGYIASNAGLTSAMFTAMRLLLNRVPGGLACATGCATRARLSGGTSTSSSREDGRNSPPRSRRGRR